MEQALGQARAAQHLLTFPAQKPGAGKRPRPAVAKDCRADAVIAAMQKIRPVSVTNLLRLPGVRRRRAPTGGRRLNVFTTCFKTYRGARQTPHCMDLRCPVDSRMTPLLRLAAHDE